MTTAPRFALIALALVALAAPATARAQDLPPSLTVDTGFALGGVNEYDFRPVFSDDVASGAGIDATLNRSYAVGSTETAGGDTDVAVVARRADGTLDPSFAGDGSLALAIEPGEDDAAVAIAVLPDSRLRLLASTATGSDVDVALVGLLADGSPDPDFGGGDGIVSFSAGGIADAPAGLAVAPDGRLAITGATAGATGQDTFVTVRDAAGEATPFGVRVLDRGGATIGDAGVDVAWRGSGLTALIEIDGLLGASTVLHGFDADGADDPTFGDVAIEFTGASDVLAGGLLAYNGDFWVTGTVETSADRDAYIARVNGSGGDLQTRRFDMRGSVFAATQPVNSEGRDLALAVGEPDALVVGGATTTDRGTEWAAAAFNLLPGALGALQAVDLVIPVEGQGGADSLAAASGGRIAAAGTMRDFSVENGGTNDLSVGMARVLVDAEKRCDLTLAILEPVELILRGTSPGRLTFRVTNSGTRACSGAVSVPAPYTMTAGAGDTGRLTPGQSYTRTVDIGYGAPFPYDDSLVLTLTSAPDVQPGDNVARVRVMFAYCDLELALGAKPAVLGTEGARRFEFTIRNRGTAACNATQIVVGATGRRIGPATPFTVGGGRSVSDEFDVGVAPGTKSGRPVPLAFTVTGAGDIAPGNNGASAAPMVVRPGDTNVRKPSTRGKRFLGSASRGTGKGVRARTLRVARVEVAILRGGDGCRWLSSDTGNLRTVDSGARGACDQPVWVKVRGTSKWELELRKALPRGRYTLRSRAILANGVAEGRFTTADRNLVRFRVR